MAPIEVGKFVEVSPNDVDLKDAFFTAKIIEQAGLYYYCMLMNHVDEQGKHLVLMLPKSAIRPIPPIVVAPLCIGDVVDVPLIEGWWKTTVVNLTETHVLVKLAHHDVHLLFAQEEVRIHQTWNRRTPSYWRYKKID